MITKIKFNIYIYIIMKKRTFIIKQKIIKNTRKKNKKKSTITTTSKKYRPIISGRPKVSFPYVYFILAYDKFKKYYKTLNPYLLIQTNACDDKSIGKKPEVKYNKEISFLKDNSEFCVLVLKYDDAYDLNNDPNMFNNINFLNRILGHAKLKYYNTLSLLGIYNVCLHPFNIELNPEGKIVTEEKRIKPGYGSVLFNSIKTSISFLQLPFDKIWLGIDINNVNFKKIAWLYASKGFEDPIFSDISPDGKVMPFYFIQLTSKKTSYINNKDDALIPYYETIDLYKQIQTPLGQEGIFNFKFKFDKTAILTLRVMPFYSFSETKQTIGIDDYSMQRETAGRFLTYKSDEYNGDIINKLSLEISNEKSSIKYVIGEKSNVSAIEGENMFHTHPFVNYKIYNTLIGPPSSPDLTVFMQFILKGMQTPMSKIQKFAAVIAIEGIYIYSLSIDGIRHLKNGRILTPDDIKQYEYPFNERKYDWSTYGNAVRLDRDLVNDEIKKYFNWFENVNKRFGDYFKIDFKPWKEINEDALFEVYYYNGNRTKVAPKNVDMEIVDEERPVHDRPEIVDERPFKKQRINGGKKRTNKKRTNKNRTNKKRTNKLDN